MCNRLKYDHRHCARILEVRLYKAFGDPVNQKEKGLFWCQIQKQPGSGMAQQTARLTEDIAG